MLANPLLIISKMVYLRDDMKKKDNVYELIYDNADKETLMNLVSFNFCSFSNTKFIELLNAQYKILTLNTQKRKKTGDLVHHLVVM